MHLDVGRGEARCDKGEQGSSAVEDEGVRGRVRRGGWEADGELADDLADGRELDGGNCGARGSARVLERLGEHDSLSVEPEEIATASKVSATTESLSLDRTSTKLARMAISRRRSAASTADCAEIHPSKPLRERSSRAA